MKEYKKDRIARISYFEEKYDRISSAVSAVRSAIEQYRELADDIRELEDYYTSRTWQDDLEADERGELPSDLKRGVLSQDGVYDLLDDERQLREEIRSFCADGGVEHLPEQKEEQQ